MADERIEEIKERLAQLISPLAVPADYDPKCTCGTTIIPYCEACDSVRRQAIERREAFNRTAEGDIESLLSEVERLRSMIQYALDGPDNDINCLKSILFDALNGCTGADNLEEIRAKYGEWGASVHGREGKHWKDVGCPTCDVKAGESCGRQKHGVPWIWERTPPHAARKRAAIAAGAAPGEAGEGE